MLDGIVQAPVGGVHSARHWAYGLNLG